LRERTATSEGGIVVVEIARAIKPSIHRGLPVQHNNYFKTALKGLLKDSEESVVRLVYERNIGTKRTSREEDGWCLP
jgi:hypothetical protein